MSEAALRRQVERIAAELARTQAEVQTLRRAARRPQLGDSSIDSGALEVRDPDTGATRLRLGYQPDGTVGVISEGGDPPPVPTGPVVEGIPAGLSVTWNATLSGDGDLPGDFDHVNVHVSEQDGFTPDEGTFVGTITRAGGSLPVAPLEVGTTYYVRLVGVTTSGVQGEPSAQASGVPEAVGGVPEPGSITETEIADDAISTPKLQAEAVTALKIAANAIEAGHISAGAVEADKLAAVLVLASRIVAGDPAGARVELNSEGLRAYSSVGALTVAVDAETGDAVYTGTITGSQIVGSSLLVGDETADHIWIGEGDFEEHVVRARGGGAQVEIAAVDTAADVRLTPPPHAGEGFYEGVQYAYVAVGTGFAYPAVAYTSPSSELILPRGATAEVQLEGASATVDASRVRHRADVHHFSMGGWSSYLNGVIEVDPALSIRAPAHAPRMVSLLAQPTGSGNNGVWTDFTTDQFERLTWRTGYSGRVDFRITMCGINNSTPGATLSLGFRLTSSTEPDVPPGLSRAAMVRARAYPSASPNSYGEQQQLAVGLQLAPNTEYTVIPCWRASGASATWGTGATDALKFDAAYANTIEIINTM